MKLQTYDSNISIGQSYFDDKGTQNYTLFQQLYNWFKTCGKKKILFRSENPKDCVKKVLNSLLVLILR